MKLSSSFVVLFLISILIIFLPCKIVRHDKLKINREHNFYFIQNIFFSNKFYLGSKMGNQASSEEDPQHEQEIEEEEDENVEEEQEKGISIRVRNLSKLNTSP